MSNANVVPFGFDPCEPRYTSGPCRAAGLFHEGHDMFGVGTPRALEITPFAEALPAELAERFEQTIA